MSSQRFLRTIPHLIRRLIGHVLARPLGPAEQAEITAALSAAEGSLFWALPAPDQRHAYETAKRVEQLRPDDPIAVKAMLLHDVGKTHSRLGVIGRSLATIAAALRLPLPPRWRRYRDHGRLGAADLEQAGADPAVVSFAAHHGSARPSGFDEELWTALTSADDV